MLEQGPARHQRVPVGVGQGGAGVGQLHQIGVDQPEGPAGDEHGRAVEDVLAGRAPVDPVPCVALDRGGEGLDQRDDRIATQPGRPPDLAGIEVTGHARLGDRRRRLRWHDPHVGLRRGQGGFDVEQGLQPGPGAGGLEQFVGDQDGLEEATGPRRVSRQKTASPRHPADGCRSGVGRLRPER